MGAVIEEIHDIPGLEPDVRWPVAIVDTRRVAVLGPEFRNCPFLACPMLAVRQDEQPERIARAGQIKSVQQPPQGWQYAPHILITHCHNNGGRWQRLTVGLPAREKRGKKGAKHQ
jgi:hypothetical protein